MGRGGAREVQEAGTGHTISGTGPAEQSQAHTQLPGVSVPLFPLQVDLQQLPLSSSEPLAHTLISLPRPS